MAESKLAAETAEAVVADERLFSNGGGLGLVASTLIRRFSFRKVRILENLRCSSSKDTIVVDDIGAEVELRVNIFVPILALAGEDASVDDADVLCVLAVVLATPGELAVGAPDKTVERDGRRNISLFIGFLALRRKNALGKEDFATSVGKCHRAGAIVIVNTETNDILAEFAYI